jgi:hypothetical protein
MKKSTIWVFISGLLIMGTLVWFHLNWVLPRVEAAEKTNHPSLFLSYEGQDFNLGKYPIFLRGEHKLSADKNHIVWNAMQLKLLADQINDKSQKGIVIKGLYLKDEINSSTYKDLGLARAMSVKEAFVSYGISEDMISVSSEPISQNVSFENEIWNTIEIGSQTKQVTSPEEEDIKVLRLSSVYGNNPNISRDYWENIISYLNSYKNKSIVIYQNGIYVSTKSKKTFKNNLQPIELIKDEAIKNGISPDQIRVLHDKKSITNLKVPLKIALYIENKSVPQ